MKTYNDIIDEDRLHSGQYEVDGLRSVAIDTLIIHHSAGGFRDNWRDKDIVQEISDMHKKRFYNNGLIKSHHTNRYKGEPVYCAYHILARKVLNEGWRFTPTMWGLEQNVAGGTKSVNWNRRAIQICILGDYEKVLPADGFVDAMIHFFAPFAAGIKSRMETVTVMGHKEAGDSTTCPGRIMELIPEIKKGIGA